MPDIDLQGPLEDFYGRTSQIRVVVATIECAPYQSAPMTARRSGIDLSLVSRTTENTANAMSLVFLASSYEEFIREEIGQCVDFLTGRYSFLGEESRNTIRNAYWMGCLERLRSTGSILTKNKPKVPDANLLDRVRLLLDSASGFVINDDPATLDRSIFYQHQHNFRPNVVDDIARRLGINDLMENAADSNRLRAHFGVTKKSQVAVALRTKMNEFYERRNSIVHSLSANTGYAVDVVLDYIELFEAAADSIRNVLEKNTSKW